MPGIAVGDVAAFPAGAPNGLHLVNRADQVARFFIVGTRTPTETAWYSAEDMMVTSDEAGFKFTRKDGSPLDDSPSQGDEK